MRLVLYSVTTNFVAKTRFCCWYMGPNVLKHRVEARSIFPNISENRVKTTSNLLNVSDHKVKAISVLLKRAQPEAVLTKLLTKNSLQQTKFRRLAEWANTMKQFRALGALTSA